VPLEFYRFTDDTVFVPSIVEPQLPPPDKVIDLEVVFDTMDDGTNHAMFNSKTFNMPKVPTLLTQAQYAAQNISASVLKRMPDTQANGLLWQARWHLVNLRSLSTICLSLMLLLKMVTLESILCEPRLSSHHVAVLLSIYHKATFTATSSKSSTVVKISLLMTPPSTLR